MGILQVDASPCSYPIFHFLRLHFFAEIVIRESVNYWIYPRIGKHENTHNSDRYAGFDFEITQLSKKEVHLIWKPTDYKSQ